MLKNAGLAELMFAIRLLDNEVDLGLLGLSVNGAVPTLRPIIFDCLIGVILSFTESTLFFENVKVPAMLDRRFFSG